MNYRYITNKNHREIGLLFTNLPLGMKHHLVETSHSISRHHAALWSSWVCRNIKSPNILCLALFPQTSSPYNIPIRLAIHDDCSPNSSNSSLNPILDLRCKDKQHSLAQLDPSKWTHIMVNNPIPWIATSPNPALECRDTSTPKWLIMVLSKQSSRKVIFTFKASVIACPRRTPSMKDSNPVSPPLGI